MSEGKKDMTPSVSEKSDVLEIIKRLIGYMTSEGSMRRFMIALVIQVIALLFLVSLPYLTGQAINVVSEPGGSITELQKWVVLGVVAGALFILLSFITERVFADLSTRAVYRLQRHLFAHIQTLSLNFFDRQPLGELMSRVTNDTENVALFYENAVAQVIRSLCQVVLIVIVMFVIQWELAIAALTVVPVIIFATAIIERVSAPAFAKLQENLGELSGFQEETISGTRVIISNRRHDWAMEANEQLASGVYDVASKAFFTSLVQFPLTQGLIVLQMVIVLFIGGILVITGDTTLGVVVAFTGYASLLSSPLSQIANLTSTTLSAVAGGRRVFSIIDEQPQVVDHPDAKPFEFRGGHVQFEDVDFSYVPGRQILKHNTFEAAPGQMIGICGPTGAGKSTIINILTRYYDIDRGTILIDEQDLSTLTQDSLRTQVGTVLQEAFLFSDTVMNNLKYAREGATDEECVEAAKQANAHDFIMKLPQGYDTIMTERGANLSQGQRQMITIARAMVADPKMLILDEATSNVDTRTEHLIQEGLQRLMAGRTSFVIAHRLSTIRNAQKILVVNGGEIVEQGSHDELMAMKGFYYTLYMSQFKGKAPAGSEAGSAEFVTT